MLKKQWHSIVIFFTMLFFAIITGLVFSGKTEAIDSTVYEVISRFHGAVMTHIAMILSFIGSSRVIVTGLIILLLIPKTRKAAVALAATAACSALINDTLKKIFQRSRPTVNPLVIEKSFSYPSGHSMSNMALYTMLALLLLTYMKRRRARVPAAVGCFLLAIGIGLSRIYLGVHYPSDVAGGFLMGFTIALTIYAVFVKKEIKW